MSHSATPTASSFLTGGDQSSVKVPSIATEGDLSDLQEPHDAHERPAERNPHVSRETKGELPQADVKDGASTNRPASLISNASSDLWFLSPQGALTSGSTRAEGEFELESPGEVAKHRDLIVYFEGSEVHPGEAQDLDGNYTAPIVFKLHDSTLEVKVKWSELFQRFYPHLQQNELKLSWKLESRKGSASEDRFVHTVTGSLAQPRCFSFGCVYLEYDSHEDSIYPVELRHFDHLVEFSGEAVDRGRVVRQAPVGQIR